MAPTTVVYQDIDAMIAEMQQALTDMAPAHEGLRDYAALNLHKPDTQEAVNAAVLEYDRRRDLLNTSISTLQLVKAQLQADGYPVLEIPDVEAAVLADLKANKETIEAAYARFHLAMATSLNSQVVDVEPK